MLMIVSTYDGGIRASLMQNDARVRGVRLGSYKLPLTAFCILAAKVLKGGDFGWPRGEIPPEVGETLTTLFEQYEKHNGKWVFKNK